MEVTIVIKSPVSQSDVFELRNYLTKEINELELTIKEQPPQEGEMVVGVIEPILLGVVNKIISNSAQDFYDNILKPKLLEWLNKKVVTDGKKPEIISSVTNNTQTVHFLENQEGETIRLTDFEYSIDKNKTQAILIGNSEFTSPFPPIPPVKGNLEDLYNLLTDVSRVGIPKENVTVLYNKNNFEIEEVLLRKSRLQNIQTLFIYFAGHGYRADIKKLYLLAKNTRRVDDFIIGGIDFDFISSTVLKNSKASQRIFIVDACHSGIAAQGPDDLAETLDVEGTYILASSSGDEVSYYNKNNRNTYFTEAIINLLTNGLEDTQEMVALEDLYEKVKRNHTEKNLSLPVFKNTLNIPASNFFLSRNPNFSQSKYKLRPHMLFEKGMFEEALLEYKILLSKYPDDKELKNEANVCQNEVLFQEITCEADELYSHKSYKAAAEKYKKVLRIKRDPGVANKLNKCLMKLASESSLINPTTENNKSSSSEFEPTSETKVDVVNQKSDNYVRPVQHKLEKIVIGRTYKSDLENKLRSTWHKISLPGLASIVFSILLIIGFFTPWISYVDPYSAWEIIFIEESMYLSSPLRYLGVLIPICGGFIIYKALGGRVPKRRLLFCLPFVSFCVLTFIIYNKLTESYSMSISYIIAYDFLFGIFITFISSLCLLMFAFFKDDIKSITALQK